ncbi:MAG: hypothetical protein KF789_00880 [Bdellovibrionaceae bacterium]|nr:hypothetical protein [Pseudobdellovibrionaceae bacterium]
MIKLNQMNHWMILSVVMALLSSQAWGAAGVTYHGRLLKPNGRPVSASNVQFRLQIRTPAPNSCLLYEEIHVRDLSQTQGVFSITLNDGALSKGGEFSLWESFRNHGEFSFLPGRCSIDSNYTANISDGRQLFVSFNDGSFSDWEPLPAQEIAFVPFSLEAMSVNGRKAESFFRVEDAGVPQVMPPWDSAKYLKLQNLVNAVGAANGMTISGGSVSIGGTAAGFTGSIGGDVTGTQGSTKVEKLQGRTVLDAVPAQGQVLTWSHANSRWEPANLPAAGAPAWGDITGKPTSMPPSGGASGDLTGDYPGPTIANSAVTASKIGDEAVTLAKLQKASADG